MRHVDRQTFFQLGSVTGGENRKASHFTYFEKSKPDGAVRICALGDSFTFGDETGRQHDYPSYLQHRFETAGASNVQVINFGNSWYGFSQSIVMWESVASEFQCDFVLLMPFSFWSRRDTTFNHTDLNSPEYLHARHIIDGDSLKLVPVIGNTREERFDAYFGFIPEWTYLRYDRNPPAIIRSMLQHGRTIENWFYYEPRPAIEEAFDIYERLVARLADSADQVIIGLFGLFNEYDIINRPMQRVRRPNVTLLWSMLPSHKFPYHSPVEHYSAWGNELVARLYFSVLTGKAGGYLDTIEFKENRSGITGRHESLPLHEYDSITLSIANRTAGTINPVDKELARDARGSFHTILRDSGVVSLLAVKTRDMELADACLIPLYFRPDTGTPLHLQSANGGTSVKIGEIYYPNPHINMAVSVISSHGIECLGEGLQLSKSLEEMTGPLQNSGIHLALGNETLLTGVVQGESVSFMRQGLGPYKFRASGEYLSEYDRLAPSGTVDITLQRNGTVVTEPLFAWEKKRNHLPFRLSARPSRMIAIRKGHAYVHTDNH